MPLRVKNLASYQHYKHRRPAWVKLHRTVLESYEFGRLHDASKWLAVGCVLLASECDNAIPDDVEWIARRLQMDTTPDIEALVSGGFLERYDGSQSASKTLARRKQNVTTEKEKEKEYRTTSTTPAAGGDASVPAPIPPATSVPADGSSPPRVGKPRKVVDSASRQTWVTPIASAWEAEFGGGAFPVKRAVAALAPLVKAHGAEEVAKRVGYYARHHKRFPDKLAFLDLSFTRFATTFAEWNPDAPAFGDEGVAA